MIWQRRGMSRYRRRASPTGLWFFTLCLAARGSTALCDEINLLRWSWAVTAKALPFETVEAVILPDHLHCIWRLPEGDSDFPARWQKIKAGFSRHAEVALPHPRPSLQRRGEKGLWQRRYWEHAIRDADDLALHRAFCASDPYRHGLVGKDDIWPFSSRARQVQGIRPEGTPGVPDPALPRLLQSYGTATYTQNGPPLGAGR